MTGPDLPAFAMRIDQGDRARDLPALTAACLDIFPGFDITYLSGRLGHVADPALIAAWEGDEIVAFKLGYRRGDALFYSWLGGVRTRARRRGLAERLMAMQHEWVEGAGYAVIETRTRAANNPMILLNLRHGFHIAGFEVDAHDMAIVTQRKFLASGAGR